MKPTLLVLAAGMGSRYGGLKQIDPIGPCGEIIIDYSLYDAKAAGFDTAICIIKHSIEADFKAIMDRGAAKHMNILYAYQEIDDIPEGFEVPEGRGKPWGTGGRFEPAGSHQSGFGSKYRAEGHAKRGGYGQICFGRSKGQ